FTNAGTIPLTITSIAVTTSGGGGSGPTTDYALNPYLNDPAGGIATANVRRRLNTISDGASNTILVGHAYIARADYTSTTGTSTALAPIFKGGTLGTARS